MEKQKGIIISISCEFKIKCIRGKVISNYSVYNNLYYTDFWFKFYNTVFNIYFNLFKSVISIPIISRILQNGTVLNLFLYLLKIYLNSA